MAMTVTQARQVDGLNCQIKDGPVKQMPELPTTTTTKAKLIIGQN